MKIVERRTGPNWPQGSKFNVRFIACMIFTVWYHYIRFSQKIHSKKHIPYGRYGYASRSIRIIRTSCRKNPCRNHPFSPQVRSNKKSAPKRTFGLFEKVSCDTFSRIAGTTCAYGTGCSCKESLAPQGSPPPPRMSLFGGWKPSGIRCRALPAYLPSQPPSTASVKPLT